MTAPSPSYDELLEENKFLRDLVLRLKTESLSTITTIQSDLSLFQLLIAEPPKPAKKGKKSTATSSPKPHPIDTAEIAGTFITPPNKSPNNASRLSSRQPSIDYNSATTPDVTFEAMSTTDFMSTVDSENLKKAPRGYVPSDEEWSLPLDPNKPIISPPPPEIKPKKKKLKKKVKVEEVSEEDKVWKEDVALPKPSVIETTSTEPIVNENIIVPDPVIFDVIADDVKNITFNSSSIQVIQEEEEEEKEEDKTKENVFTGDYSAPDADPQPSPKPDVVDVQPQQKKKQKQVKSNYVEKYSQDPIHIMHKRIWSSKHAK